MPVIDLGLPIRTLQILEDWRITPQDLQWWVSEFMIAVFSIMLFGMVIRFMRIPIGMTTKELGRQQ